MLCLANMVKSRVQSSRLPLFEGCIAPKYHRTYTSVGLTDSFVKENTSHGAADHLGYLLYFHSHCVDPVVLPTAVM